MTIPTPTKARGSYLYKYSSPAHLEWLKTIILEHELYLPSLDQLNDPTVCTAQRCYFRTSHRNFFPNWKLYPTAGPSSDHVGDLAAMISAPAIIEDIASLPAVGA
jgi:hypothetical protein